MQTRVGGARIVFAAIGVLMLSELGSRVQMTETNADTDVFLDNTIACQGKQLKLRCHNTSLALKIYSAMYGRTEAGNQICPYENWDEDSDYYCGESDVTSRLETICDRRTKCRIQVERAVFGDICPGKDLYLQVIYSCEYRRKKKNSSTATPSKLTTTSDLDTTTAAKSTQRTPLNKITNFTTASVPVTKAVNTTEEPYTDKMVGLSSKEHMVTENIITPKPVPVNSTQPAAHAKTPVVTGHSLLPPAVVLQHSRREPVGIWSTLVVWFLFMQDHSATLLLVFFSGVAGALLIAAIAAVCFVRPLTMRRKEQRLKVIEVPLNTSPPASQKTHMATKVMLPPPGPRLVQGTLPRNPPSDYHTEYPRTGGKEPASPRNVTPRMVVRADSSKEIYKKDLNIDRIRSVHAKNDGFPEVHAVIIQKKDGSSMYLNPMYADHIPYCNEPDAHETL